MEQPWQDEELLRKMYVEKGMTHEEIADELGCIRRTVGKFVRRYNIEKSKPEWADESKLREMYREMGVREIADEFDVGGSTIWWWINKYDIVKPWKDKEKLQRMYVEDDMNQEEIAEQLGCSQSAVSENLRRFDIETDDDRKKTPYFGLSNNGYERFQSKVNGSQKEFLHHRLLAVAKVGFDGVCGKVVHHENNIPWDNRENNISVMSLEEHTRMHQSENYEN